MGLSALSQQGQYGPPSSGELPASDPRRREVVEQRQLAVAAFLEAQGSDALLIERPENFAWFTAGGDASRSGSSETTAALFVTSDARVVVTSNVDSGRLFDRELYGLGFQLKERPWQEPRRQLIEDLCRGRKVAGDTGPGRTRDVADELAALRLPLSEFECDRLRALGREVAHAVEATARYLRPGRTETEIAGELAHRLLKRSIVPERLQVSADGNTRRYRWWGFGGDRAERFCILSAVGRRHGLCALATRTVSFGPPAKELRDAHYRTILMQAAGMYFSQAGLTLGEAWRRVERIYEKFDYPNEWRLADQGEAIGYHSSESVVTPGSDLRLEAGYPIAWHPSIGPALVGDTILVKGERFELLTPLEKWPRVTVKVKDMGVVRPGIYVWDDAEVASSDSILSFEGRMSDSVLE
ncbi:MAG: M24 family metallopeptidase [Planctomycetes bacterium]|nr:M24 family metallopeptidase [Planctomycetota bacterium]